MQGEEHGHGPLFAVTLSVQDLNEDQNSLGAVDPWDYTPYFYLLMTFACLGALSFIAFINPQLRRTDVDNKTITK